jgi:hypothetical protein
VFCLEHAVEIEQQLRQIGGVHIFLLCHPGVSFFFYFCVVEAIEVLHSWNEHYLLFLPSLFFIYVCCFKIKFNELLVVGLFLFFIFSSA